MSIRGVRVNSDDPHLFRLEPLLWSFLEGVEAFCRAEPRSPPYWFNERASVSLIAGAAWRTGWLALEEYATKKVLVDEAEGHPYYPGRCDLYIRRPGLDGYSFAFEAKQVMGPIHALADRVTSALKQARDDARLLHRTEADARIALVFIVPGVLRGNTQTAEDIDRMIRELVPESVTSIGAGGHWMQLA